MSWHRSISTPPPARPARRLRGIPPCAAATAISSTRHGRNGSARIRPSHTRTRFRRAAASGLRSEPAKVRRGAIRPVRAGSLAAFGRTSSRCPRWPKAWGLGHRRHRRRLRDARPCPDSSTGRYPPSCANRTALRRCLAQAGEESHDSTIEAGLRPLARAPEKPRAEVIEGRMGRKSRGIASGRSVDERSGSSDAAAGPRTRLCCRT